MFGARRLARDGAWALAGQLLAAAGVLASFKLWAVYLEPAEVGYMGLIAGLASAIFAIAVGPLTQSIMVSYAAYAVDGHTHEFRAAGGRLVSRISLGVVAVALVGGIPAAWLLGFSVGVPLLVAGQFAVDAWRAFETSLFAAARRQKQVAILSGGDAWFRTAFLWLALTFFPPCAYTALSGVLAGSIVFLGLARVLMRPEAFPARRARDTALDRSIRDRITRLSRPLFPAFLFANTTETLNRYLIAATLGLAPAGLFVVSYGLVRRPYALLNSVTDWTMRPALASAIAENDAGKAAHIRRLWLAVGGGIALVGVLLFYVLREQIVRILLSSDYGAAADLFVGLAIAIALFNIANIFGGFSLSAGNSRAVLINHAAGAITSSLLVILLSPLFGLYGAVWALLGGYSIQLAVAILTSRRTLVL